MSSRYCWILPASFMDLQEIEWFCFIMIFTETVFSNVKVKTKLIRIYHLFIFFKHLFWGCKEHKSNQLIVIGRFLNLIVCFLIDVTNIQCHHYRRMAVHLNMASTIVKIRLSVSKTNLHTFNTNIALLHQCWKPSDRALEFQSLKCSILAPRLSSEIM